MNVRLQTNNILDHHTAQSGAGIYVTANCRVTLDNSNQLMNNHTIPAADGNGGGVCAINSDLKILGDTLIENSAASRGGGVFCRVWDDPATTDYLSNAGFTQAKLTVKSGQIKDNEARYGGGLYAAGPDPGNKLMNKLMVEVNEITVLDKNSAAESGGGSFVLRLDEFIFETNKVSNNTAKSGGGGYVNIRTFGQPLKVRRNDFIDNWAVTHGTGLVLYSCELTRRDVLINTFRGVRGGGAMGRGLKTFTSLTASPRLPMRRCPLPTTARKSRTLRNHASRIAANAATIVPHRRHATHGMRRRAADPPLPPVPAYTIQIRTPVTVHYRRRFMRRAALIALVAATAALAQPKVTAEKEAAIKADLVGQIDAMKKQAQVMVDSVFSFGELGFQEFETSKYLSGILEKEGFKIERGIAGIPTVVGGHLGIRQAGDLAGIGYRRHPAGLAEARRGLARAA